MITMHARPRQTDGRANIMAIARRFVLTSASRANNNDDDGNIRNEHNPSYMYGNDK